MTKLFVRVAGLDRDITKEDRIAFIQDIFSPFVELSEDSIAIIPDKEFGGYRNFLFVEIEDEEVANKAIEALDNSTTEEGFGLIVNVAKPKEEGDRKPGGFKPRGNFSSGGGRSFGPRREGNGGGKGGFSGGNNRY